LKRLLLVKKACFSNAIALGSIVQVSRITAYPHLLNHKNEALAKVLSKKNEKDYRTCLKLTNIRFF
jgi:hypothetical protein